MSRRRTRSTPAPPGGDERRGGVGGHVGAPHVFVSHVECTVCGHRHDAKRLLTVCERCSQMLAVRYDLERVKAAVGKDALRARPPGMYRFRELTPLADAPTPRSP
jgi:hypothetical protein